MSKRAHIIQPDVPLGEKALTLCGRKHLVKRRWDEIPDDFPICRDCVDAAILAMTETSNQVGHAQLLMLAVLRSVRRLSNALEEENVMTDILSATAAYAMKREEKKERKAKKAAEKEAMENGKQCTCLWTGIDERVLVMDCPVHGDGPPEFEEAVVVEPPVAPDEGTEYTGEDPFDMQPEHDHQDR